MRRRVDDKLIPSLKQLWITVLMAVVILCAVLIIAEGATAQVYGPQERHPYHLYYDILDEQRRQTELMERQERRMQQERRHRNYEEQKRRVREYNQQWTLVP